MRLPPSTRLSIENWAKQQKHKPSRSEAIRRLIEIALATKPKTAKQPRREVTSAAHVLQNESNLLSVIQKHGMRD
jgi:metal-responsive CopG/Arc/MetJ family transcriptional regulator